METDFEVTNIFFDTAPYIYLLDFNDIFREQAKTIFSRCIQRMIKMKTSVITVEEFCVKPLRDGDTKLTKDFERFLRDTKTYIAPIDKATAYEAAQIRARFPGFKGMDSLQLASAKLNGCELFVTNDKQLKQYDEMKVLVVSELGRVD